MTDTCCDFWISLKDITKNECVVLSCGSDNSTEEDAALLDSALVELSYCGVDYYTLFDNDVLCLAGYYYTSVGTQCSTSGSEFYLKVKFVPTVQCAIIMYYKTSFFDEGSIFDHPQSIVTVEADAEIILHSSSPFLPNAYAFKLVPGYAVGSTPEEGIVESDEIGTVDVSVLYENM